MFVASGVTTSIPEILVNTSFQKSKDDIINSYLYIVVLVGCDQVRPIFGCHPILIHDHDPPPPRYPALNPPWVILHGFRVGLHGFRMILYGPKLILQMYMARL